MVALEATKHTQRRQAIQPELLTVAESVNGLLAKSNAALQVSSSVARVIAADSVAESLGVSSRASSKVKCSYIGDF